MKRIRIQKPKPRRRIQAVTYGAVPHARSAGARRLLEELDALLAEIDRSLETDRP